MSSAAGAGLGPLRPTPPQRGSFPLDHFGDCTEQMKKYMKCLKLVHNDNAPNCRLLAKEYLDCRMKHDLMDKTEWKNLGLPDDPQESKDQTEPHKD